MTEQLNDIYQQLYHKWSIEIVNLPNSNRGTCFFIALFILSFIISGIISEIIPRLINREQPSDMIGVIAGVVSWIITVSIMFISITSHANTLVNNALNGQRTNIKQTVYQQTVLTYKDKFETKKWLYNANIVYHKNNADNVENNDLNAQITEKSKQLTIINHNLKKLKYLNQAANLNIKYTRIKQLYPNIAKTNPQTIPTTINPSQLSDDKLQTEIKQSINHQ